MADRSNFGARVHPESSSGPASEEGLRQFFQDAKDLADTEPRDVIPGVDIADWLSIRRFCASIGDANPLYRDVAAAAASRFSTMIAPNTFIFAIRTPNSTACLWQREYSLVPFFTRTRNEWNDVIRLGDRIRSDIRIADVRVGRWDSEGPATVEVVSKVSYWSSQCRIGEAVGTVSLYPRVGSGGLILDRDVYRYSDDEIARIVADIDGESAPRGSRVRYWSDVSVGDSLPELVKGPLTLSDLLAWRIAEAKDYALGPVALRDLRTKYPGRIRTNPTTGWSYQDSNEEFEDILACRDLGFNMPVSRGEHRTCLAGQVCTDWMGDEGFLRRLDATVVGHWCYGDTMWLGGVVVGKRTEDIGSATYGAVDVRVNGKNQLRETILTATATIYLPMLGRPVQLPIAPDADESRR